MATIDVLGVLRDGSPQDPGVPLDNRALLRFAAGEDLCLRVALVTSANVPVRATLWSLSVSVWRTFDPSADDTPPDSAPPDLSWPPAGWGPAEERCRRVLLVPGTPHPEMGANVATFLAKGDQTRRLRPGRYAWDLRGKQGARQEVFVQASPLALLAGS